MMDVSIVALNAHVAQFVIFHHYASLNHDSETIDVI